MSPRYSPRRSLAMTVRVDLAGGDVGRAVEVDVEEALVVADVQVGLGAVVGDEHLTVLEGVHRARVDVQVRVELLHRDPQAPRLEQRTQAGGGQTLAEGGGDTPGDEDVLGRRGCWAAWPKGAPVVAVWRCVPASSPEIPGGAVAAVRGFLRTTGPRATRVSATRRGCFRPRSAHRAVCITRPRSPGAHPFGSAALPRAARRSLGCVVSCSDTRCRAGRPTAPPRPSPGTEARAVRLQRTLTAERKRPAGRRGRSTGDARGRAHRGLRTHRRHADRRPGLPGRHGRLAVPAPLRLPRRLRRPARHRGARLLAPRPGARGRTRRHRRRPGAATAATR